MVDIERVRTPFQRIEPLLDERGRRFYAANEAMALGRGGVMAVAAATGIARSTINRGMCELRAGSAGVSVDPVPVANARSSANLACWPLWRRGENPNSHAARGSRNLQLW
jgi:hypothetical protein